MSFSARLSSFIRGAAVLALLGCARSADLPGPQEAGSTSPPAPDGAEDRAATSPSAGMTDAVAPDAPADLVPPQDGTADRPHDRGARDTAAAGEAGVAVRACLAGHACMGNDHC